MMSASSNIVSSIDSYPLLNTFLLVSPFSIRFLLLDLSFIYLGKRSNVGYWMKSQNHPKTYHCLLMKITLQRWQQQIYFVMLQMYWLVSLVNLHFIQSPSL